MALFSSNSCDTMHYLENSDSEVCIPKRKRGEMQIAVSHHLENTFNFDIAQEPRIPQTTLQTTDLPDQRMSYHRNKVQNIDASHQYFSWASGSVGSPSESWHSAVSSMQPGRRTQAFWARAGGSMQTNKRMHAHTCAGSCTCWGKSEARTQRHLHRGDVVCLGSLHSASLRFAN